MDADVGRQGVGMYHSVCLEEPPFVRQPAAMEDDNIQSEAWTSTECLSAWTFQGWLVPVFPRRGDVEMWRRGDVEAFFLRG